MTTTNTTPLWLAEFGAAYAVPDAVTSTLEDLSWHNDVCPSFITKGLAANPPTFEDGIEVRLWVDHPLPAEREVEGALRYRVVKFLGEPEVLFESETDLAEALAVLQREAAKYTLRSPERLAEAFLRLLRVELSADDYAEACRRNAAEANAAVCHSHDFCDANVVMAAAFAEEGLGEVDVDNDAMLSLWNTAWNLAFHQMGVEASAGPDLRDLLERTISVFEQTATDNVGETVAQAHEALYAELQAALKRLQ